VLFAGFRYLSAVPLNVCNDFLNRESDILNLK